MLNYYKKLLGIEAIPEFLLKYLEVPCFTRLKKVGYFCGMDYASKDIYNFSEYISRYDHSITVALQVYKHTEDKLATLAGLFHDISTPCFSHVIDYMNQDYELQESTEAYTEEIMKNDPYLRECLKMDDIDIEDIIAFKKYTIVDNERPKLCADRIDGVILTGMGWTHDVTIEDIFSIVNDLTIEENEDKEKELSFKTLEIAKRVVEISKSIDYYCHSKEDNYMMQLLARITSLAIDNNYITYKDLYYKNEEELFSIYESINDKEIQKLFYEFKNIKKEDIEDIDLPKVKVRKLNPMVNGKRI